MVEQPENNSKAKTEQRADGEWAVTTRNVGGNGTITVENPIMGEYKTKAEAALEAPFDEIIEEMAQNENMSVRDVVRATLELSSSEQLSDLREKAAKLAESPEVEAALSEIKTAELRLERFTLGIENDLVETEELTPEEQLGRLQDDLGKANFEFDKIISDSFNVANSSSSLSERQFVKAAVTNSDDDLVRSDHSRGSMLSFGVKAQFGQFGPQISESVKKPSIDEEAGRATREAIDKFRESLDDKGDSYIGPTTQDAINSAIEEMEAEKEEAEKTDGDKDKDASATKLGDETLVAGASSVAAPTTSDIETLAEKAGSQIG